MRTTADAVIIGAGIMGCAIAHALAERGLADVVVLETDQIGRGATADAAGGVRQQFSTETEHPPRPGERPRLGDVSPSASGATSASASRATSSCSPTRRGAGLSR